MSIMQELERYKNFDELARDVVALAKEILPEQLIYLSAVNDTQQVFLKVSNKDAVIRVPEGLVVNLNDSLCRQVDFEKNQPLIYENISKEVESDVLRHALEQANVKSYLGLPISHVNGERFGTLCVVHHEESHYDEKSIQLLQRIVRMFSYYLELERCAYRDSLTDLYNRHFLSNTFDEASKTGGVLFFLDLDGFKKVNDIHGHETGDFVLKEVAQRLHGFVKEHKDTYAVRLGGDEFVIHCCRVSSEEEISKWAAQLLAVLSVWGGEYEISASIGIVIYPGGNETNLSTLLKQADNALYRAKAAGKNMYKF